MNIICRFRGHRFTFVRDVPLAPEGRGIHRRWVERCRWCGLQDLRVEHTLEYGLPADARDYGTQHCTAIIPNRHGPGIEGLCEHPHWSHGFWYGEKRTDTVKWNETGCVHCRCEGFEA